MFPGFLRPFVDIELVIVQDDDQFLVLILLPVIVGEYILHVDELVGAGDY